VFGIWVVEVERDREASGGILGCKNLMGKVIKRGDFWCCNGINV
jgi:hypothetical protein